MRHGAHCQLRRDFADRLPGSFHVPVGDEVFGHVGQVEEEIGNAFTLLQIGRVFGEAVAHGETVQSPSLSAAPERIVRVTLVGTLHADFTVFRMIVYHMVGRVVRAEMIFRGWYWHGSRLYSNKWSLR